MATDQAKMYRSMEKDFVAYLNGEACIASIALTKALRLQQIACGFFMNDEGEVVRYAKNPRLDALKEVLEQICPGSKAIVWATFRGSYDDIASVCDSLKLSHVSLYGGMSDKQRQESIDSFQTDPNVHVMIANQAAGGTGVNLTAASYSVYFSRSWNLEHDAQSEARCHRGGSEVHEKITRVDLVCPGSIDEEILNALSRKENLANNILKLKDRL
jgi:DNA excision repair protein ERCC-6